MSRDKVATAAERTRWWRRKKAPSTPPVLAIGWPATFDEYARAYLAEHTRRRVTEMSDFITSQEAKASTLFGVSVLLAGAGLFSQLVAPSGASDWVLSSLAFSAAAATWLCALGVFTTRRYELGTNVKILAEDYPGTSAEFLRDLSLEIDMEAFDTLCESATIKGRWLRWLPRLLIAQAVLTLFAEVAASV